MIVRLTLGSGGPRLAAVLPPGNGSRRRGARRALVVVSQDLYCESAAGDWSGIGGDTGIGGTGSVLEARCRGRSYTASGTLLGYRDDAGIRGLLVPVEAFRSETSTSSRNRGDLLFRARRSLRLARIRFRRPGRARLILVRTALVVVFATSLVTLAATSAAAIEARTLLARAASMNAELTNRRESLVGLREEARLLRVGASDRLPALPGELVSALAATLTPGERIRSVEADGFDITLVAEGDLGLGARVDALDRIRTIGHTVTNREGVSMVTIRARQEGGDR